MDSFWDLLDENQKAAEQLLVNITAAKEIVEHVNDSFIEPLKPVLEESTTKELKAAFEDLKTHLNTEATEFSEARDKYTAQFHEIEQKVVELDARVDESRESLEEMWDAIRKSVEALDALTREKDNEEEEHHTTLSATIEEHLGEITQQQEKKKLLVQELHDATEAADHDVDELATQHEETINTLEQTLTEKSQRLQDAFRNMTGFYTEQEEETATSISEAVEQVLEQMRTKLADEVPSSLNDAAEALVTGAFSEVADMATQSQESLNNTIEQILEKMREVGTALVPVKPVLNTIESIG